MRVEIKKNLAQPFVLTAKDLEEITVILENSSSKFLYKAVCTDEGVREFNSVNELNDYENLERKQIRSLGINGWSISAETYEVETKVFIHFSSTIYSENIKFNISGEESVVEKLVEYLNQKITRLRPWYWLIAEVGFKGFLISMFMSILIFLPINLFIYRKFPKAELLSKTYLLSLVITNIVLFMVIKLIEFIKKRYFPSGVFAIGDGVRRQKNDEIWRQVVIVGLFIGVIASSIVAVFSS